MTIKRSHEPVVWSLFGAGGIVAAFVLPAVVLTLGLLYPLGLLSDGALSYERVMLFSTSVMGKLIWFAVIVFSLWHGMHRIYHGLHDLKLPHNKFTYVLCYGLAFVISIMTFTLLIVLP